MPRDSQRGSLWVESGNPTYCLLRSARRRCRWHCNTSARVLSTTVFVFVPESLARRRAPPSPEPVSVCEKFFFAGNISRDIYTRGQIWSWGIPQFSKFTLGINMGPLGNILEVRSSFILATEMRLILVARPDQKTWASVSTQASGGRSSSRARVPKPN